MTSENLAGGDAVQEDTEDEVFVLDRVKNVHEKMTQRAVYFRRVARAAPAEFGEFYQGYMACMCDATGLTSLDIDGYLDRNDDLDTDAIGHKEARTPPSVAQRVEIRPK